MSNISILTLCDSREASISEIDVNIGLTKIESVDKVTNFLFSYET